MKKKDERLVNNTEMRMTRWIQGVSLREHKRNEEIKEAATVQAIATFKVGRCRMKKKQDTIKNLYLPSNCITGTLAHGSYSELVFRVNLFKCAGQNYRPTMRTWCPFSMEFRY